MLAMAGTLLTLASGPSLLPCNAALHLATSRHSSASHRCLPFLSNFSLVPSLSQNRTSGAEVPLRRRGRARVALRGIGSGVGFVDGEGGREIFSGVDLAGEWRSREDKVEEGSAMLVSPEVQLQGYLGRAVGATAAVVGAVLLSSGAAVADEVVESGAEVAEVVGNSTISVLFVAATVGLVVLTVGVVYLSVQEFLEKRAVEAESKAIGQAKKEKKTKEKEVVRISGRSGPKGFGGKRLKDDAEE